MSNMKNKSSLSMEKVVFQDPDVRSHRTDESENAISSRRYSGYTENVRMIKPLTNNNIIPNSTSLCSPPRQSPKTNYAASCENIFYKGLGKKTDSMRSNIVSNAILRRRDSTVVISPHQESMIQQKKKIMQTNESRLVHDEPNLRTSSHIALPLRTLRSVSSSNIDRLKYNENVGNQSENFDHQVSVNESISKKELNTIEFPILKTTDPRLLNSSLPLKSTNTNLKLDSVNSTNDHLAGYNSSGDISTKDLNPNIGKGVKRIMEGKKIKASSKNSESGLKVTKVSNTQDTVQLKNLAMNKVSAYLSKEKNIEDIKRKSLDDDSNENQLPSDARTTTAETDRHSRFRAEKSKQINLRKAARLNNLDSEVQLVKRVNPDLDTVRVRHLFLNALSEDSDTMHTDINGITDIEVLRKRYKRKRFDLLSKKRLFCLLKNEYLDMCRRIEAIQEDHFKLETLLRKTIAENSRHLQVLINEKQLNEQTHSEVKNIEKQLQLQLQNLKIKYKALRKKYKECQKDNQSNTADDQFSDNPQYILQENENEDLPQNKTYSREKVKKYQDKRYYKENETEYYDKQNIENIKNDETSITPPIYYKEMSVDGFANHQISKNNKSPITPQRFLSSYSKSLHSNIVNEENIYLNMDKSVTQYENKDYRSKQDRKSLFMSNPQKFDQFEHMKKKSNKHMSSKYINSSTIKSNFVHNTKRSDEDLESESEYLKLGYDVIQKRNMNNKLLPDSEMFLPFDLSNVLYDTHDPVFSKQASTLHQQRQYKRNSFTQPTKKITPLSNFTGHDRKYIKDRKYKHCYPMDQEFNEHTYDKYHVNINEFSGSEEVYNTFDRGIDEKYTYGKYTKPKISPSKYYSRLNKIESNHQSQIHNDQLLSDADEVSSDSHSNFLVRMHRQKLNSHYVEPTRHRVKGTISNSAKPCGSVPDVLEFVPSPDPYKKHLISKDPTYNSLKKTNRKSKQAPKLVSFDSQEESY